MINDQKLATREREIARLFQGARSDPLGRSGIASETGPASDGQPTTAQRIEKILRRAEREGETPLVRRPVDLRSGSPQPRKLPHGRTDPPASGSDEAA